MKLRLELFVKLRLELRPEFGFDAEGQLATNCLLCVIGHHVEAQAANPLNKSPLEAHTTDPCPSRKNGHYTASNPLTPPQPTFINASTIDKPGAKSCWPAWA